MKNNRHLFTYAVECIATIEVETDKDWDELSEGERQDLIDRMSETVSDYCEENIQDILDKGDLDGDNVTYQGVAEKSSDDSHVIKIKLEDWE